MPAGNIADRHARLQRLVHDQQLLLRRKPPPAGNAGDDFHLRKRLGHRRMPRTMPSSSGHSRCPVKTGGSSVGKDPAATSRGQGCVCGVSNLVVLRLRPEDSKHSRGVDGQHAGTQTSFFRIASYACSSLRGEGASIDRSLFNFGAIEFSQTTSVTGSGSLIRNQAT